MIRALVANKHASAAGGSETSSLRTCVVTRVELAPEKMIRFVCGPDGDIVPDLARKLPGRGIWITCHRAVVRAAIENQAFGRAARAKVRVASDLDERVEVLLVRRVCDQLSLANKAGLVITGSSRVNAWMDDGAQGALVQARDASVDGLAKVARRYRAIRQACGAMPIEISLLTIDELSLAIGRPNVVHAAVSTGKAATNFLTAADRVAKYRAVRFEKSEFEAALEPACELATAIRHTGKA